MCMCVFVFIGLNTALLLLLLFVFSFFSRSTLPSDLLRADVAFRTTPTAAIAMSDWDASTQSQASSDYGGDDDYHMHDVLLSVSDILLESQKIVMVSAVCVCVSVCLNVCVSVCVCVCVCLSICVCVCVCFLLQPLLPLCAQARTHGLFFSFRGLRWSMTCTASSSATRSWVRQLSWDCSASVEARTSLPHPPFG